MEKQGSDHILGRQTPVVGGFVGVVGIPFRFSIPVSLGFVPQFPAVSAAGPGSRSKGIPPFQRFIAFPVEGGVAAGRGIGQGCTAHRAAMLGGLSAGGTQAVQALFLIEQQMQSAQKKVAVGHFFSLR